MATEHGVSEAASSHRHSFWAAVGRAVSATVGALAGVVPHLLHHVGLLLSVPLLRRLHRRFRTWKAPAVALALFAAVFALSALVIGPAIADRPTEPSPAPAPSATPTTSATGSPPPPSTTGHDQHHGG
jgi:hypothetical protein